MSKIGTFYEDASKIFNVDIVYNGSAPDISSDTVTLYLFDEDGSQSLSKNADVATSGASGTAIFNITPAEMDLTPKQYTAVVKWTAGTDELIVIKERVTVESTYIG